METASKILQEINKLATDIADEIDGLLEGQEPEPTIVKQAKQIAKLSGGKQWLAERANVLRIISRSGTYHRLW